MINNLDWKEHIRDGARSENLVCQQNQKLPTKLKIDCRQNFVLIYFKKPFGTTELY